MDAADQLFELFFNPFTIVLFLSGLSFLIAGFVMSKFPPKKINSLYGYRTGSSMKSQETWDFAQRKSANDLKLFGFGMMIISFGGMFLPFGTWGSAFALFVLIGFCAFMFFDTEKALKRRFG